MPNFDLQERVTVKSKEGEFHGKIMQVETSKRTGSTIYKVTVHIHEREEKLSAPMGQIAKTFPVGAR